MGVLQICLILILGATAVLSAPRGHLEPLGSSSDLIHVENRTEILLPHEFYKEYMLKSKPVLLKGLAKQYWKAATKWKDDNYLNETYGKLYMMVEQGKKENRDDPSFHIPIHKFIKTYKKADQYMVESLPVEMRRDLALFPCLTCGGFIPLFDDVVMWFSSGGTKSVLHHDSQENIGCLIDGRKQFIIINEKDIDDLDGLLDKQGYSGMDVDKVDMNKYSMLQGVQMYVANVEAGDCLFVPQGSIHQVRSWGRNLASNLWFGRPRKLDKACTKEKAKEFAKTKAGKVSLDQFPWKAADEGRAETADIIKNQEEPLLYDEFVDRLEKDGVDASDEEARKLWKRVFKRKSFDAYLPLARYKRVKPKTLQMALKKLRKRLKAKQRDEL